jgi:hypothetical protein
LWCALSGLDHVAAHAWLKNDGKVGGAGRLGTNGLEMRGAAARIVAVARTKVFIIVLPSDGCEMALPPGADNPRVACKIFA